MSPEIVSQQPTLLERLNLFTAAVGIVMFIGGVGGAYALTTYRVSTLETTIKEGKEARNKQIEGIEQKIDELREKTITREEFKDYMAELKANLAELKADVRDIRNEGRKR